MEKDSGTVFRELKEDVSAYVELKLELLKLSTYERTGKVIAVLSYGLIYYCFWHSSPSCSYSWPWASS